MSTVTFDRCFTMATFLAFTESRSFRMDHPDLTLEDSIATIKKLKSSASAFDYDNAMQLMTVLDEELAWDNTKLGLRLFVSEIVKHSKPWWMRFIPYGREKVRAVLTTDAIQCFREAGLFDAYPDKDVIRWWDDISTLIRNVVDTERMVRARNAERLSFEHERKRLTKLGIRREPEWVSLEDNTLGYDIRSYDRVNDHIVSRLIEVKSTLSDTIFLSRNEWDNAATSANQTVFHVWEFPNQELHEYPVAAMEVHIPHDQGSGLWKDLKVTLSF